MKIILMTISLIISSFCAMNPNEQINDQIDKIFEEFTAPNSPGASVAVIKDGEIIFSKGYGLADVDNSIPIEPKTNFRLASVTKQFTAMCILMLADRGEIYLESTLAEFFPDFPEYGKKITVKHLLTHTSGLLAYEDFIDDTATIQVLDSDVLEIMKRQDSTYFEPGTMYRYSNSGYAVLAKIVEKVSDKSFAEFLEENIFDPLGMDNSLAYEKGISEVPNRAFGYAETDSGFVFSDQSLTSAVLGDGGIYTSTVDMYKWDQALWAGKLVNPELQQASWTKAKLSSGEKINYGYGWHLDEYKGLERIYHSGSTCGFSNIYIRLPAKKLSVLALMNIRDLDAIDFGNKVVDLFLE